MIDINKLSNELQKAKIIFSGCNDAGVVWGKDGKTEIQNRPEVKAVIAAHDPTPEADTPTIEERLIKAEAELAAIRKSAPVEMQTKIDDELKAKKGK
jgi:hypothetical protein